MLQSDRLSRRIYFASALFACVLSLFFTVGSQLTGLAPWFPPVWPGVWFSWLVVIMCNGESWANRVALILVGAGNAMFYFWISYRVMKADALAGGRFTRSILR
jgi:hypothetical protein